MCRNCLTFPPFERQAEYDTVAIALQTRLDEKEYKSREIAESFREFKREVSCIVHAVLFFDHCDVRWNPCGRCGGAAFDSNVPRLIDKGILNRVRHHTLEHIARWNFPTDRTITIVVCSSNCTCVPAHLSKDCSDGRTQPHGQGDT